MRSHAELEPNLNVIGNISESTSVLMMNGENDSQTSVQQAFLLEQRLTEVNHPDHTLLTYPNLGHLFSPSSQRFIEFGPIEQQVLSDLHRWLSDHTHGSRGLDSG
ncbi:MAG: alpha/beta hydrolase family protein [Nitrososphaera sp.]